MRLPRIAAFFAPVAQTPEHIRLAEDLGFAAAWCYDSPLLYLDPFVTLGLAAQRTERIALGVGVCVPRMRAPAITQAALRTLTTLAPGRVRMAVGAGFTGRFTLGLGPAPLAALEDEVGAIRDLLAGRPATHAEGGAQIRAIPVAGAEGGGSVPIYIACRGERAQALARRAGDGAMSGIFYPGGIGRLVAAVGAERPVVVHAVGAVADPGEPLDSPRLAAAVGPVVAVAFHAFCEQPWRLDGLDDELRAQAADYLAAIAAEIPAGRRHQELHRGHLVEIVHAADRSVITPANIARFSFTGTAGELRARAAELATAGVAELAIQPGGDIPSELRRLAAALIG